MNLRQQLIAFEGRRCAAYRCSEGIWTIGLGHTGPEVCDGLVWTDAQIDAAFDADIAAATRECFEAFPWATRMNEPRQAVLIGMLFQMGITRVRGFGKALAAMRDERFAHAAHEMLDSRWRVQTPKRAARLAAQMETGEWA